MVFFRSVSALSKLRSRFAQQSSLNSAVRWLQIQTSSSDLDLHSQLKELIPEQQERLKKLKTEHGKVQLGNITVDMVPKKEQVDELSKEVRSCASVPEYVYEVIDALPVATHPMTQFATGVMALQVQSEFQKAYEKGIPKSKYWEPTYEDSLNLIARVPVVAAYVYRSSATHIISHS